MNIAEFIAQSDLLNVNRRASPCLRLMLKMTGKERAELAEKIKPVFEQIDQLQREQRVSEEEE